MGTAWAMERRYESDPERICRRATEWGKKRRHTDSGKRWRGDS